MSHDDQHDLPLMGEIDPDAAVDYAEAMADATDRGKWPKRLLELTDLAESLLTRHASRNLGPRETAELVVAEIANYLGGRPVYLPRGEALKRALRDRRIWRDSGHIDPDTLSDREGVCVQQIYKIIGEMRSLERKRRQGALFPD